MQVLNELMIDENNIAFHPSIGNSYQLNDVSREILELLKKGFSKEQIFEDIAKEYNADESELYVDINDFLAKLKLYGLYHD